MIRLKNKILSRIAARFPFLIDKWVKKAIRWDVKGIPWVPMTKPLKFCKIAIITTAGVHLKTQKPFNMQDKNGDPSFREIPGNTPKDELMITHDYYDHRDADKDINIVFPIDRLNEMIASKELGSIAQTNYGFMGHIDGSYINILINKTAPMVAEKLRMQNVDAVLLTPG